MISKLEVLERARDLISEKDSWARYDDARNKHGDSVDFEDAEACAWCSSGAIFRVLHDIFQKLVDETSNQEEFSGVAGLEGARLGTEKECMDILNNTDAVKSYVLKNPDWKLITNYTHPFVSMNDDITYSHSDILLMFDQAIEELKNG